MKRIIAIAAVSVAALSGAASAMTAANDFNTAEINRYAPDADVSGLSNGDIAVLLTLIHSADREGEKRQQVNAFLNK